MILASPTILFGLKMSSDQRYQVFVSSTYEDLREERHEVIQALLELDCIPAGMELFPATDDDQWTLIKRVIDECDYYILIIGGRYGSIGPSGISYTEQEYLYAVETGKPIIAFLHKSPDSIAVGKSEKHPGSLEELGRFRELAQNKTCKYWTTSIELGSIVSRSVVRLIKTHPMPGWIRADKAAESIAATEILRLKKTIEDLQGKLKNSRLEAPSGAASLAQGDEEFPIEVTFHVTDSENEEWILARFAKYSWNDIFEEIGPHLMVGASDDKIRSLLNGMVEDWVKDFISSDTEKNGYKYPTSIEVASRDENTIKIQLRALGLIERQERGRGSVWVLTSYGDLALVNLIAIEAGEFDEDDEKNVEAETKNGIEGEDDANINTDKDVNINL